jgi:hypothetical protein
MKYYNISSKKEYNSEEWFYYNKNALEKLYYSLLKLSESYGILLKDNEDTINYFIIMMYNESDKTIIDKNLFPEYFNIKYNRNGYEKYKILEYKS